MSELDWNNVEFDEGPASSELPESNKDERQKGDVKIHPFYGGPFSNWANCSFAVDGVTYTSSEQFMMAKKAMLFGDHESLAIIMGTDNPAKQKAQGKLVKRFVKEMWEAVAKDVVFRGCMAKFTQNAKFHDYIMNTGEDIIVEASPTDRIWGVGIAEDDPDIYDKSKWKGTNWLGEVLMDVRKALRDSGKLADEVYNDFKKMAEILEADTLEGCEGECGGCNCKGH